MFLSLWDCRCLNETLNNILMLSSGKQIIDSFSCFWCTRWFSVLQECYLWSIREWNHTFKMLFSPHNHVIFVHFVVLCCLWTISKSDPGVGGGEKTSPSLSLEATKSQDILCLTIDSCNWRKRGLSLFCRSWKEKKNAAQVDRSEVFFW